MQFTPQQLVGAGRYAPATRIGNWNEDLMLEEARMKEFQLRKLQGSLLATHKLKHDFLHQKAPRSGDAQQRVLLHHAVALGHLESDGALCANVFEESPSIGSGEFLVTVSTATPATTALARNTFRLVSPAAWKEAQAAGQSLDIFSPREPLRYGEPFLIMCNEALLVDDQSVLMKPALFLKSGIKTERSMSPISYHQRVWLAPDVDSAALWVCERADLARTDKFLAAGDVVTAGDRLAIVHKMTGQPLCADSKNKQPTDFGVELEVCAHGTKTAGKHHNLAAEVVGLRTPDTEARASLPPNTWTFVLAASAADARDDRSLPALPSAASVAAVLQRCLATESLYAFRRFLVGLARVDARRTGYVSRDDAKWFIMQLKLPLRPEHLDLLFDVIDKRNTGNVALAELLGRLRVPVAPARKAAMEAAFARLSAGATLTPTTLAQRYDPQIDARVRANELSEDGARTEYRDLWLDPQRELSARDFVEMYSDVSMALENDRHFAQLMEESWR
ncbi:hypothetical protein P43SY_009112 [Pythium insidiosum]|uniref:EF-hand domain-containing protein n=1 Tax=Pythium insidiosum TaxID=114742 RepID=A0AAD5L9N6_PYTIN|nr:hypothetical protein P43SY_009112 [Pythium insidiosum]